MPTSVSNAFITGVSSGIGHALSIDYLEKGWRVLGCSRRRPTTLISKPNFYYHSIDLQNEQQIVNGILKLMKNTEHLDLVVLNAGTLGRLGDVSKTSLDDLQNTFLVNVLANKVVLDTLFSTGVTIKQVVAMSSGVSVNGSRGWSGYSISKAALNMFVSLYAHERPNTHFTSLAPGIVDTEMQEHLCTRDFDERFPGAEYLRTKRGTADMPRPREAAAILTKAIERFPLLVDSGSYVDIRQFREV